MQTSMFRFARRSTPAALIAAPIAALALTILTANLHAEEKAVVAAAFAPFASLLDRHLTEYDLAGGGLVSAFDYRAAIDDPDSRRLIDEQRRLLADFELAAIDTRERALAFWINAYNFFMIAHIVDHPVDGELVASVKDYGSLFNPFRVFEREIFDVGGRKHSLDEIEKGILLGEEFARRGWKDARVHFAVNCASLGCPPLRAVPYTAANIERLLETNTRRALATPLHLRTDGSTVRLTRLFDWYRADFEEESGSIEAYVIEHAADEQARAMEQARRVRFIDYDWALNSPENIEAWMETRP